MDKLSRHISGSLQSSLSKEFDDEHFAKHGRVYLKLFQTARCMKLHCLSGIVDTTTKHALEDQVESLEEIMKNYRFMSFSQIQHAQQEAAKLKYAFEFA